MQPLMMNKDRHYQAILNDLAERLSVEADQVKQELDFQTYKLFFQTGNRSQYEEIYFRKRKRLTALALLLLDQPENQSYQQQLENIIFSICQEFTWCLPAHIDRSREENASKKSYTLDLFNCETAFTLAEVTALLSEYLTPALLNIVRANIHERVFVPYLNNGPYHWEESHDNWAAVCASSIGATAIYLIEDENVCLQIIERVKRTLTYYLNGFGDDGACLEGLQYWQYGFRYFTYFAELLSRYTDGKDNLLLEQKIARIAAFQQKMYLEQDHVVNFSDAPAQQSPAYDLAYFYQLRFPEMIDYPPGDVSSDTLIDHCGRWPQAYRQLAWRHSNLKQHSWSTGEYWLADAQLLIIRKPCFQFAVKGGHNQEPHNHNDLGHFILYSHGQPYFIDLGAGEYTRDYFSDKRYQLLQPSSLGHSVPIICGEPQKTGRSAYAISQVREIKPFEEITFVLTEAYQVSQLEHFTRQFNLNSDQATLTLTDHYHFTEANQEVTETFILANLPYSQTGHQLILTGAQNDLKIIWSEEISEVKLDPIEYKDHFGQHQSALKLQLSFSVTQTSYTFKLDFLLIAGKEEKRAFC
ncbi:heparinase II/III domain-containing protein [Amphibacillus sediminis]|uniref:heparinase II/III domain-containing protein n=1 Tax=Amphibacillus sediminis TaxID=360185 RepID=UPI000832B1AB|nr:heparinase II/III family protein [Amphibacillus sediminis]